MRGGFLPSPNFRSFLWIWTAGPTDTWKSGPNFHEKSSVWRRIKDIVVKEAVPLWCHLDHLAVLVVYLIAKVSDCFLTSFICVWGKNRRALASLTSSSHTQQIFKRNGMLRWSSSICLLAVKETFHVAWHLRFLLWKTGTRWSALASHNVFWKSRGSFPFIYGCPNLSALFPLIPCFSCRLWGCLPFSCPV